ncbi:LacI family DNA-binding transcriptional regulator [Microbacterium sp. ZW T5_56]|uniref:LacI family DNA-binding transcriptional regulator n=1 Tax=Microbacterium sp. ZW T5_56 TaxID=3378081 RepID=UPI003852F0CF
MKDTATDGSAADGTGSALGRRPTIYDIADRLNLNPSTVSRALSKPGRVNAATVDRIRAVAAEMGYRVNPLARALPTGMSGTFGIVLPDITNPVHFELIRAAEHVARANGFTIVISESAGSAQNEREIIEKLQASVDGLLVIASRLASEELRALADVKPIVGANHAAPELPSVSPDLRPGLEQAMNHLHQLGHKRVAYVGASSVQINTARWDILAELAAERGMSIVEITAAAPTVQAGADVLGRVRASGVTAVFAYNDLVAHGLLRAARAAGVPVPSAFSVVGFDDIFSAELAVPSLTTLRSPLGEIGQRAMDILIDPDANRVASNTVLPLQLVVRESTAPPPAG